MSRLNERIDALPKTRRSLLYYAVGLLACLIALTLHAYGSAPIFAYLPLAVAAAFLFDRLCEEIVLWRRERDAEPRS